MQNESGYEGEEWGNSQKNTPEEDNSVFSEMLSAGRECFINFMAIVVSIFLAAFLVVYYSKEIINFFTFEKIVLLGGALMFTLCAFWANHNKEKIPEILEFKEPNLPKE